MLFFTPSVFLQEIISVCVSVLRESSHIETLHKKVVSGGSKCHLEDKIIN